MGDGRRSNPTQIVTCDGGWEPPEGKRTLREDQRGVLQVEEADDEERRQRRPHHDLRLHLSRSLPLGPLVLSRLPPWLPAFSSVLALLYGASSSSIKLNLSLTDVNHFKS